MGGRPKPAANNSPGLWTASPRTWGSTRSTPMSRNVEFPSLMEASDQPMPQFVELCRNDLERRWREGDRIEVEKYFAQFPALSEDRESSLLLIYSEFLLQERHGEPPSPMTYYARFP